MARLVDEADAMPEECMISFEDPDEMLRLLSAARMALLKSIKEQPDSITELSGCLHRDRSAVKWNVEALEWSELKKVKSIIKAGSLFLVGFLAAK